jgi:superfamily II DNA/RNA helicase
MLQDSKPRQKYSRDPNDGKLCVHNVVEFVAAWLNPYDMKKRYDEFTKPFSKHRVMIATTVLGMGVNIEDVEVVVCWGLPIKRDIKDLWQRIGRSGRGEDCRSQAYIFLPFWIFDSMGSIENATCRS